MSDADVVHMHVSKLQKNRRTLVAVVLLSALLLVLFVLNMELGSVYIPVPQLLSPSGAYRDILYIIRLPQGIGAIIVGIDLAIAGAVMQGILRNPLADPYITGTGSGAVLGSVLGIAAGFAYSHAVQCVHSLSFAHPPPIPPRIQHKIYYPKAHHVIKFSRSIRHVLRQCLNFHVLHIPAVHVYRPIYQYCVLDKGP